MTSSDRSTGIASQIKPTVRDTLKRMKDLENMLSNLKSQCDTDLRHTCHENVNGVYTSLLVALPGMLSSRHELSEDKCSATEKEESAGDGISFGRGMRNKDGH